MSNTQGNAQKSRFATFVVPAIKDLWSQFGWIVGLLLAGFLAAGYLYHEQTIRDLENQNRQLQGKLSDAERKMQEANQSLGISKSQLESKEKLLQDYQAADLTLRRDLDEFQRKYDLQLQSFSKVIADLQGSTHGGNVHVTPSPDTKEIAFEWWDPLHRFHLSTKNIFGPAEDFLFTYHQTFAVEAVILRQKPKNGVLEVQSVQLNELDSHGNVISKATIDPTKSVFKYAPGPGPSAGLAQQFLLGLTSSMEPELTYEPFHFAKDTVGFGASVFGNKELQAAGLTATWYPAIGSLQSRLGFGLTMGYSSDRKIVGRLVVSIPVATLGGQ
jgi:hypothetical protein